MGTLNRPTVASPSGTTLGTTSALGRACAEDAARARADNERVEVRAIV
jgi:hypothetical protein